MNRLASFLQIRSGEARLVGFVAALFALIDSRMTNPERTEYDQFMARLHSMLAEVEFNALWSEGRSMRMEQAIQLALSEEK